MRKRQFCATAALTMARFSMPAGPSRCPPKNASPSNRHFFYSCGKKNGSVLKSGPRSRCWTSARVAVLREDTGLCWWSVNRLLLHRRSCYRRTPKTISRIRTPIEARRKSRSRSQPGEWFIVFWRRLRWRQCQKQNARPLQWFFDFANHSGRLKPTARSNVSDHLSADQPVEGQCPRAAHYNSHRLKKERQEGF